MNDELKMILETMQEGFRQVNFRMDKFDSRMDNMEQELIAVKQDVAGLKQDVAGLQQDMTSVKQDVAGLKQNVAELQQDMTSVKQDVAGLKQNVVVLQQDVAQIKITQENKVLPHIQMLCEGHSIHTVRLEENQDMEQKIESLDERVTGLEMYVKNHQAV